ncbi:MAG: TrkA C-terminal domain-containing protein, partial [Lachnospiraceae bacterium]|nr:TrkA C-terminal domain-containing protein [Lachnospiraceae bacterium]
QTIEKGNRRTISINVESNSPFLGLKVKEAESKFNITVAVIVRHENILLPSDNVRFEIEDIVVYQAV